MKTSVSIESLKGPAGEFLLASVTGSDGIIGICDTSVKSGLCRKTLYAGMESLINIQYRDNNNEANRVIWQTSSIDKAKTILGTRIVKSCENYFSGAAPLSKAIMPVLELLTDGLYIVHVNKVYPTDGAGNFFWDAFTVKHEIMGSAPYNPVAVKNVFHLRLLFLHSRFPVIRRLLSALRPRSLWQERSLEASHFILPECFLHFLKVISMRQHVLPIIMISTV